MLISTFCFQFAMTTTAPPVLTTRPAWVAQMDSIWTPISVEVVETNGKSTTTIYDHKNQQQHPEQHPYYFTINIFYHDVIKLISILSWNSSLLPTFWNSLIFPIYYSHSGVTYHFILARREGVNQFCLPFQNVRWTTVTIVTPMKLFVIPALRVTSMMVVTVPVNIYTYTHLTHLRENVFM